MSFTHFNFRFQSNNFSWGYLLREITLQRKIPNSICSGIKLDLKKTGLCSFLRITTAECEIEHQLRLWFLTLQPSLLKMTKFRKRHFCLSNTKFDNSELVERPYTYTLCVFVLYKQLIVSSVTTLFPFLLKGPPKEASL